MDWHVWWLFLLTETVLSLTPGPAVLLVISQGLRSGGRRSIFSNLGILSANAAYFAISATGLGALILASYEVFAAIRWIGAAYLVWLGLSAIFGRHSIVSTTDSAGISRTESNTRLFTSGFVLQAANPKALVFFTALLPQFVSPSQPLPMQMAILGVTSVVSEFFVLLGYGMLAGKASVLAQRPAVARVADYVAGTLLLGAGAGLAALKRD